MKRVLVVDDEASFTMFLKKNLEARGGFQVTTCNVGTDAVAQARRLKPDVILLDVVMPDISGEDIANELQEYEDTRQIRVVFLTSIVSAEEAAQARHQIGGHLFVAKPVKVEDLVQVLNAV